jgi:hypothetical protein
VDVVYPPRCWKPVLMVHMPLPLGIDYRAPRSCQDLPAPAGPWRKPPSRSRMCSAISALLAWGLTSHLRGLKM